MNRREKPVEHGGALAEAERRFGVPDAGWLDLSTGINPWAYPVSDVSAQIWEALPCQNAFTRVREAAAACYNAPGPESVSVAPGSQAFIQLIPRLFPAGRVAVVGFTYNEHAIAWDRAGHEVVAADTLGEALARARQVVLTNPNNPDGRRHSPKMLQAAAAAVASRGGVLVVDEAFADVTPETSLAPWVGSKGLIVLRSFGKFFGLAGLRLGFALSEPAVADVLQDAFGPWAVSGPALEVGARALADSAWIEESRGRLRHASSELSDLLTEFGFEIVGATDLFVLVETLQARQVWEQLGRKGILVRTFSQRPTWLRFGLSRDLERLKAALSECEL